MVQQGPSGSPSSMKGLSTSLEKVIHDMKSGGKVSVQHIGEAEQHMAKLLDGLNKIIAVVAEQEAAERSSGVAAAVGSPGMPGVGTPVEGDAAMDSLKRPGEPDPNATAVRQRCDAKTVGSSEFVPPDTPARSKAEAGLMEAFPPAQNQQSPG